MTRSMDNWIEGQCVDMPTVAIESPYAGETDLNIRYVCACMADCLARGEAPYASHALYTLPGVLDDTKPKERALGINAGFVFAATCGTRVVYEDLGRTAGMHAGIQHAMSIGQRIEYRTLGGGWGDV